MAVAAAPTLECDPALANDPSALFDALAAAWSEGGPALHVDFRALMPSASTTERATHLMHPYPAKLLRHIPALFVGAEQLSAPGDVVLDPFCGSGTTLIEAQLAGRVAVGTDTNPLACLIAMAKTTPLPAADLLDATDRLVRDARTRRDAPIPHAERLGRWYNEHVIGQLAQIRASLFAVEPGPVRRFLEVCFSATARSVSLADPRVTVPVAHRVERYDPDHRLHASAVARLDALRSIDVFEAFRENVAANAQRVASLPPSIPASRVLREDARSLGKALGSGEAGDGVDVIVTSPPYLGAQKYIRASSLGLYWLDLVPDGKLQHLARQSIGREHFRREEYLAGEPSGLEPADELIESIRADNPQRAHLASVYIREMREALAAMWQVLRPGGHMVLVVGGNSLCGKPFPTPSYLELLAFQQGFTTRLSLLDRIRSRGLMTRRNRSSRVITEEYVFLFERPRT